MRGTHHGGKAPRRHRDDPAPSARQEPLPVHRGDRRRRGRSHRGPGLAGHRRRAEAARYRVRRPHQDDDLAGDPLPATETETKLSPDCFAIFPNPTSEILKLDIEASNFGKTAQIAIFSKTGQVMAKRRIEALDGTVEFNVGHYPAGTYMAQVQIGDAKPETRCFVVVD